jgi:hypothetical protein
MEAQREHEARVQRREAGETEAKGMKSVPRGGEFSASVKLLEK